MARPVGPDDIQELTAWLEADDAKQRGRRARRLQDLLTVMPVPSEGVSFLGGWASATCLEEIRRCYVEGADMAVVLLCVAYVERELAAQLYAEGWEPAKKVPLRAVLKKGYEGGALSADEWHAYAELGVCAVGRLVVALWGATGSEGALKKV